MATVVESSNIGKRFSYDWDNWLDGRSWLLVAGDDFGQHIRFFRGYAFTVAKQRGIKIRTKLTTSKDGREAIVIQAVQNSTS